MRRFRYAIGKDPDASGDVSRLEGFSDAVFAFALTLLVVSLEVPKSYDQLVSSLKGFVAFGICFLLLIQVWTRHYDFFRRYPLQDTTTRNLNCLLLFIVLAYVYPLKFLFTQVFVPFFPDPSIKPITSQQLPPLSLIYGIGFFLIYGAFACMYSHAIRRAPLDGFSPLSVAIGKVDRLICLSVGSIGLLTGISAMIRWPGSQFSLMGYILIAVVYRIFEPKKMKLARELRAELEP